ncbi:hypothetical protein BCR34DRAFT_560654 [Clohesyomyces aquaticus]|uniref:WD40-repeat-containing domain protein n=1 Tax=Clohesyomyces aquaticus TaxID=1231657 RepID=A0A1Y1ZVW4_9PLEO|nr:hypothetical protein BCR34DRAFT_560654 [Clohesyomyces aquaticus]
MESRPSRRAAAAVTKYIGDPICGLEQRIYASSDSGSSTTEPPSTESDVDHQEIEPEEEDEDEEDFDEPREEWGDGGEGYDDDGDDDGEEARDLREEEVVAGLAEESTRGESSGGDGDVRSPVTGAARQNKAKTKRPPGHSKTSNANQSGKGVNMPGLLPDYKFAKRKGTRVYDTGIEKGEHIRGVGEWGKEGGRIMRAKWLFGPSLKDLKPVLLTRDKWERQETLPSRRIWGMGESFYVQEGAMEKETSNFRTWYWGSTKSAFERGQAWKVLKMEEGEKYLENDGEKDLNLLMGPYIRPALYPMKHREFINASEPFEMKEDRRGWTFSLGARIQDAQFSPHKEWRTQYLAVAVQQKRPGAKNMKPFQNPKAPAFSRTKEYPTSIQIWTFPSTEEGDMDMEAKPQLEAVICTDWGMVKQFRWCPVAAADSVGPKEEDNNIHLGLLAVIFSDGVMRILDIWIPKQHPASPKTRYVYFSKAAFEIQTPDTIPTCLNWLSGTTIALGTAAGWLSIWTLTRPDSFAPKPTDSTGESAAAGDASRNQPMPWLHKQAADTYILDIKSGYPSRPHYLSVTSADGFSRLIDIRSPTQDTVTTCRARIFGLTQAWHEHTQAFLTPDENYLIRSNSIRRYYMNLHSMRMESQILACATSPWHPCVLIGGADGMCAAGNPLARMLNQKELPWQQIWFWHEWRRPVNELPLKIPKQRGEERGKRRERVWGNSMRDQSEALRGQEDGIDEDGDEDEDVLKPPQEALDKPLSRMTEGYQVTQVGMTFNGQTTEGHTESGKFLTIHEEKTGITCLAWNPNLRCGAWAVAGMADGLLRVEDLGL